MNAVSTCWGHHHLRPHSSGRALSCFSRSFSSSSLQHRLLATRPFRGSRARNGGTRMTGSKLKSASLIPENHQRELLHHLLSSSELNPATSDFGPLMCHHVSPARSPLRAGWLGFSSDVRSPHSPSWPQHNGVSRLAAHGTNTCFANAKSKSLPLLAVSLPRSSFCTVELQRRRQHSI